MACRFRIEQRGAWYQVTNRCVEPRVIYGEDRDRRRRLALLEEAVLIFGWIVPAQVMKAKMAARRDCAFVPRPFVKAAGRPGQVVGVAMGMIVLLSTAGHLPAASPATGNSDRAHAGIIVRNGSFSSWEGNVPGGWTMGEGEYAPDAAMRVEGQYALRMVTKAKDGERTLRTSIQQNIRLLPNKQYRLRFWLAKEGTGRVDVQVRPIQNGAVVAPRHCTGTPVGAGLSSGRRWK